MTNFVKRLKALRKDTGLSMREFAETINMGMWKYAQYEKGANKPSIELLRKLYITYEIDVVEWILDN